MLFNNMLPESMNMIENFFSVQKEKLFVLHPHFFHQFSLYFFFFTKKIFICHKKKVFLHIMVGFFVLHNMLVKGIRRKNSAEIEINL